MNADHCTNYETVKDSNAYFLGVKSAEVDAYSRGCLAGTELGKSEALCGITEDAKSMMARLTGYDQGNEEILVLEEERLLSSKGYIEKDEMYKITRHLAEKLFQYEEKYEK